MFTCQTEARPLSRPFSTFLEKCVSRIIRANQKKQMLIDCTNLLNAKRVNSQDFSCEQMRVRRRCLVDGVIAYTIRTQIKIANMTFKNTAYSPVNDSIRGVYRLRFKFVFVLFVHSHTFLARSSI